MKKLFLCMLTFLFVLSFSACAGQIPEELNLHIDSPYTAQYRGEYIEGLLIYTPEGNMYIDVSTPDELYGLSYSWQSDFTLGYRGLNAITEDGYLPDTAFAQAVKNTLDNISSSHPAPEFTEKQSLTVKGKTESGSYTVLADLQGNILEIAVPGLELTLKTK